MSTRDIIQIEWKSIEEIPTEHWENNYAISPLYLVHCGYRDGLAVLGYTNYSFATKSWIPCYSTTARGNYKNCTWPPVKWTEIKI